MPLIERRDFCVDNLANVGNKKLLFPIGGSDYVEDLFLLVLDSTSEYYGSVIWTAGEEVERHRSFDEFFLALVEYNKLCYERMTGKRYTDSLVLDSKTAIRVYFTAADAIQNHVIKVGDNTLTPVLSGNKVDNLNEYYVEITNIGAGNLETQYTVVFEQASDNYQVKISAMSMLHAELTKWHTICHKMHTIIA